MPTRSSKRLAGCIVIESLLAPLLFAADFEYHAGFAVVGQSQALVLEDRNGHRAILAEAEFSVSLSVSDFVAAQLLKDYGLDRAGILIRGANPAGISASAVARRDELTTAIGAALGQLKPASVRIGGAVLSVSGEDGRCLATFPAGRQCAAGAPVHAPIRSAFQIVEPVGALQARDAGSRRSYPVQAIALGRQVTFLALSGDPAPLPALPARGLVMVNYCNDTTTPPAGPQFLDAVRQVLGRVGQTIPRAAPPF